MLNALRTIALPALMSTAASTSQTASLPTNSLSRSINRDRRSSAATWTPLECPARRRASAAAARSRRLYVRHGASRCGLALSVEPARLVAGRASVSAAAGGCGTACAERAPERQNARIGRGSSSSSRGEARRSLRATGSRRRPAGSGIRARRRGRRPRSSALVGWSGPPSKSGRLLTTLRMPGARASAMASGVELRRRRRRRARRRSRQGGAHASCSSLCQRRLDRGRDQGHVGLAGQPRFRCAHHLAHVARARRRPVRRRCARTSAAISSARQALRQVGLEHRDLGGFLVDQIGAAGLLERGDRVLALLDQLVDDARPRRRRRARCARRLRAACMPPAACGSSTGAGASLARIAAFMSSVMRSFRLMASSSAKQRSPQRAPRAGFWSRGGSALRTASWAAACCARA